MNYLTIAQVQEKLGLSARQAKALFHVEDFPCLRIGHTKLVREDLLDEWASSHMGTENAVKLDYTKV